MNPIDHPIPSYQMFYEHYISIDFKHCDNHIHALYQYYRLYCVYHLMEHTQNHEKKYDYFIRIRPDLRLMQDIMPLLNRLESDEKLHLIMEHDHLFIADQEFESLFKFIEKFCSYTHEVDVRNPIFKHFLKGVDEMYCDQITRFCPERQLLEYIHEIILDKQFLFDEAFLGITYPSYYLLYRGNGQYGYAEYNEKTKWVPYQETLTKV